MSTIFDFLTVGAFVTMAGAYFYLANGDQKVLFRLMVPAISFAVANQLGNKGFPVFAVVLLVAGAAYAIFLFRNRSQDRSDR
jgi:hypothetical protein